VAELRLPMTLTPPFRDLPPRLEIDAAIVWDLIERMEERWAGQRDRLCDPGPELRRHIHVYVDQERRGLDTPLGRRSRIDVVAAISGG
jgi:hypothetical protein